MCDPRFSGSYVFFRVSDDRGDKKVGMLVIMPSGKWVIKLDHIVVTRVENFAE